MSKVNWVLAGIGDIARKRVIPAIQAEPRSALYGFVTRDAAKAKEFPGAKTWATMEEAVADPAVDAVYIALPVALHAIAAITALRAGKHVLCEKPMAINYAQAEQMVAGAARQGACSAFRIIAGSIQAHPCEAAHRRRAPSAGRCWPRPTATAGSKSRPRMVE